MLGCNDTIRPMADAHLVDPLGRTIVLHDRTWYGHIVKGHPNVSKHRVLAESAVRAANEIRFSRSDADCRLYYGSGPRPGLQMVVVADVLVGVVKTAYLSRRVSGGDIEWTRFTLRP